MSNRITINGNDFTGFVEGIDEFTLTYALDDDTKTVNVAYSNALVFRGDAFDYLQPLFFGAADARDEQADIQIISDCCNNTFDLKIQADAIEVCFETCEMTTQAFEETDDIIAANKMKELPIFANLHVNPKMKVCFNFGFWQNVLTRGLLTVLEGFEAIADFLDWLGLADIKDILEELRTHIVGCRGTVSTFYISKILDDSLGSVGLTLSSSILQSGTYANAVWLDASEIINGGGLLQSPNCGGPQDSFISTLTMVEFLEILSDVFNADYRIRNGVLTFERKDFFFDNAREIVDVEQKYRDNKKGSLPCYSYSDEIKYAAGRFVFSKDDIETAGNKNWFEHYRLNKSFNEPFNSTRKGLKEVDIPVAPASFAQDGFQTSQFDDLRPPGTLVIEAAALLERALPKIIVIQPQDNEDDWFCGAIAQDFNRAMWLRVDEETTGELYDNFHSICDSRISPVFLYELEEYTYLANCDEKQTIINNRLDVHAMTRLGKGFPSEIDIEVNTGKVTLKETKILQ